MRDTLLSLLEEEIPVYQLPMIDGSQVRAARAMLRMSQQELAEAAGISIGVIKGIEASRVDPRASTLARIEQAFRDRGLVFIDAGEVSPTGGRGLRLTQS